MKNIKNTYACFFITIVQILVSVFTCLYFLRLILKALSLLSTTKVAKIYDLADFLSDIQMKLDDL